jgi:hypothetical protein
MDILKLDCEEPAHRPAEMAPVRATAWPGTLSGFPVHRPEILHSSGASEGAASFALGEGDLAATSRGGRRSRSSRLPSSTSVIVSFISLATETPATDNEPMQRQVAHFDHCSGSVNAANRSVPRALGDGRSVTSRLTASRSGASPTLRSEVAPLPGADAGAWGGTQPRVAEVSLESHEDFMHKRFMKRGLENHAPPGGPRGPAAASTPFLRCLPDDETSRATDGQRP